MPLSESEKLEIDKKKLEIQKLKNEIGSEKFFPTRIFAFWQAIFPSIVTLLSVAGTIFILYNTKFFENANTLYDIKNRELKAEQERLVAYKNNLDNQINNLQSKIVKQQLDSSKLADSLRGYRLTVEKFKGSVSDCENDYAKLKIQSIGLENQLSNLKNAGYVQGLETNNNVLQDKISSMRSRIHEFDSQFRIYENELKTNPASPPSVLWLRRDLDWLVSATDKPEPN